MTHETHETYEQALAALAGAGFHRTDGDSCAEIFDYEDAESSAAVLRRCCDGWEIEYAEEMIEV